MRRYRGDNKVDFSKAPLMGFDRNIFTLRVVLNQTRGKRWWQVAPEEWAGWGGRAEKHRRELQGPGLSAGWRVKRDEWRLQFTWITEDQELMCTITFWANRGLFSGSPNIAEASQQLLSHCCDTSNILCHEETHLTYAGELYKTG